MNVADRARATTSLLSAFVFGIGAIGFLVRRNVLVQLMSIELMLNAVNLTLVAFNRWQPEQPHRPDLRLLRDRRGGGRGRGRPGDRAGLFRLRKTVHSDEADLLKN